MNAFNLTPEQKREASAMFEGSCWDMIPEVLREFVWLRARVVELKAEIKEAFLSGYSQGNHAAVESVGYYPDESFDEYMEEREKQTTQQPPKQDTASYIERQCAAKIAVSKSQFMGRPKQQPPQAKGEG